jgi:hypothetical protein
MTELQAVEWVIKDLEKKLKTSQSHLSIAKDRIEQPKKFKSEKDILNSKIKMFEANIKGYEEKLKAFNSILKTLEGNKVNV